MKNARWLFMVVLLMLCLTAPAFAKKDKDNDKQEGGDRKVEQREKRQKEMGQVNRPQQDTRKAGRNLGRDQGDRKARGDQFGRKDEGPPEPITTDMPRAKKGGRGEQGVRGHGEGNVPGARPSPRGGPGRMPGAESTPKHRRPRSLEFPPESRPSSQQPSKNPKNPYGLFGGRPGQDGQGQEVQMPRSPWGTAGRGRPSPQPQGPTKQQTVENPSPFTRRPAPETGWVGRPSEHGTRTKEVPNVAFRGHKDPRQIKVISRNAHERSVEEIRGNVATWNRGGEKSFDRRRLPKGTIFVEQEKNRHIRARYERVVEGFRVRPSNHFVFIPRPRYDSYYFGRHDGHRHFRHHRHHVTVVTVFYYPYYYSDPAWYGFYYPGYYPSVYSLWGWCPGWVRPRRVYYEPNDYIYRGSYYGSLDYRGMEQAISDINDAWINGDIGLINNHLTSKVDIRISFNGKYSYTASADDYYAMTTDAMANMASCSVSFNRPAWISSYEIFVTGRQVFVDPDNEEHILYLSYRLRKLGYDWYIVAFGSSNRRIPNPYR